MAAGAKAPIEVRIFEATGLENMDVAKNQDPFCTLKIGTSTASTKVHKCGGENPKWTKEEGTVSLIADTAFEGKMHEKTLLDIDIHDQDVLQNDFVGKACLMLENVALRCLRENTKCWCGEVRVFRNGTQNKGMLKLEITFPEYYLNLASEFVKKMQPAGDIGDELLEATPVKIHTNWAAGMLHAMQEGDPFKQGGFRTYEVALQKIPEVFGDATNLGSAGEHPETFADTAKGKMIRGALSAAHGQIYGNRWSEVRFLGLQSEDFLSLINFGQREERRRVYTYAITDEGWFFSETGAALSKDNMSKHAIHADGALEVRYAGTFRICTRDGPNPEHVLVIDNDSGTYHPKGEYQDRLAKLLTLNLPGVEVICLNTCGKQPEGTKELVGPNEKKGDERGVYPGKWEWKQGDA